MDDDSGENMQRGRERRKRGENARPDYGAIDEPCLNCLVGSRAAQKSNREETTLSFLGGRLRNKNMESNRNWVAIHRGYSGVSLSSLILKGADVRTFNGWAPRAHDSPASHVRARSSERGLLVEVAAAAVDVVLHDNIRALPPPRDVMSRLARRSVSAVEVARIAARRARVLALHAREPERFCEVDAADDLRQQLLEASREFELLRDPRVHGGLLVGHQQCCEDVDARC